ncbi:MAG: hypothetical protein A2Y10_08865 [Planctomycetes bacterium GWF2_41_51]|nr:MAG: hypothetical protein A2Y10_08865 [Planctomycetes bacterium GWF2_41_51]HBG26226.1 DUF72 domain-containing protein [Phycisphaerales bacterium]
MSKSKTSNQIRIGTSGWYYNHWHGRFYPEDLPKSKWFKYYTENFDTVELNNSYYRFPTDSAVKKWYDSCPDNFIYAVKANRYITHLKKLRNVERQTNDFLNTISALKEKLGPILFQLPPSFKKDLEVLKDFLPLLKKQKQCVFEFRNNSWYDDDCFSLLDDFGAAFCVYDMGESQTPRVITGNMIYIRFHGTSGKYSGSYPDKMLKEWAAWIEKNKKEKSCYVYFNNDLNAYAVNNAKSLIKIMGL